MSCRYIDAWLLWCSQWLLGVSFLAPWKKGAHLYYGSKDLCSSLNLLGNFFVLQVEKKQHLFSMSHRI